VIFHPLENTIASGGGDRMVRIWDAATGQERLHFRAASSRLNAIAFSPDGKRLATGSLNGPIGLWDAATGKPQGILRGHAAAEPVFELAFNGDGTTLLSAGQHATIKLWDLASNAGVRVFKAAAHQDAGNRGSALHHARTEPVVRWVGGVAFRPDGGQLAAAGTDRTVALWEFATGRLERTILTSWGPAIALAYNHDGTRLAVVGADRSAGIWDLKTDREPIVVSDHREGIASIALSRDGKTLATGGGIPPTVVQEPNAKVAPPDGDDRSIRLWSAETGAPVRTLSGHVGSIHALAFSAEKTLLASAGADGCVRIWNLWSAEVVFTLKVDAKPENRTLFALAFSPDGTRLASAGMDRTIRYWDATTGRLIHTLSGHTNWVMGVAFSPDGARLASAGADQTVRIWDIARGRELLSLRGPNDRVHGVAFSPDGASLAAAAADGLVRVWESMPTTGLTRATLNEGDLAPR
jgi:WD40 repeat protein